MKTRILMTEEKDGQWFIPQYFHPSVGWLELFGYLKGSPYVQPMAFRTQNEAREHLKAPSIFPGNYKMTVVEES